MSNVYKHPTYKEMIIKAVGATTEKRKRAGVSSLKIKNYILNTFDIPEENPAMKTRIKKALTELVEDKKLRKPTTQTYRLVSWEILEKKEKKKKKKKTTKKKRKALKDTKKSKKKKDSEKKKKRSSAAKKRRSKRVAESRKKTKKSKKKSKK